MPSRIVVVGTSSGGMEALSVLLARLPRDFVAPIAIVQHRGKVQSDPLHDLLQRHTTLPVQEVCDKDPIYACAAYLAPTDYHLLVEVGHFALSTEAPVNFARPSIDVLFDTAAAAYRRDVVGVILSGASRDGAAGAARVKARGGVVVVQDPAAAASRLMPEAVIAAAQVDKVLPLDDIAPFVAELCRR